jgi:probable HAF family extracellular repeat protein
MRKYKVRFAAMAALASVVAMAPAAVASEQPDTRWSIWARWLGGNATFALDLNDRGQVTGNSRTGTTTLPLLAFFWSDGEVTEIGTCQGVTPSVGAMASTTAAWWSGRATTIVPAPLSSSPRCWCSHSVSASCA